MENYKQVKKFLLSASDYDLECFRRLSEVEIKNAVNQVLLDRTTGKYHKSSLISNDEIEFIFRLFNTERGAV
ncbi:hypothetical protein [Vibrio navarrensis]|uniref:hypothetical protein n=1 Tax=Vibrio navarrensis TaxID=29495 RepID=UPI0015597EEC|nr:hypothetical protein [Vibrio navarrensis]